MISFFIQHFIKDYTNTSASHVRRAYGILCGGVGIGLNLLLFSIKLFAGLLSGSIAITADAFNNLSDAGSSGITLVGFKIAGHCPDSKHPFGHGRVEYVSGLMVSMLIILMGFELGKTSIRKILHPQEVTFHIVIVAILLLSILIKIYMTYYNRRIGKLIDSPAMLATSADSLSDCIATSVVLFSMVFTNLTSINIDGYCGTFVALFILFTGLKSAKETISPLLGQPPDTEFVNQINAIVMDHCEILGIHDLIVHDYGPGKVMISLHAEVHHDVNLIVIHEVIDHIEQELAYTLGCEAIVHMDPVVTNDTLTKEAKDMVREVVREIGDCLHVHDFRMVFGTDQTNLIFEVVVPFGFHLSNDQIKEKIIDRIKIINKCYVVIIQVEEPYI